ncbi:hypothetical protein G7Y89_g10121 [Cudoniella acicularis]|uniref:Uncharacterized protein n=1 Tax=Cudoniella acicularis TaxID=354080 RepID=A0A8H4RG46_9HELO|nr:hypothetical protein G7Y89_g10121 [Cudoniella acicularis]
MQAPVADSIDSETRYPPGANTKCDIIRHFWELPIRPEELASGEINFEPYFHNYTLECLSALQAGRKINVSTHRHITNIAQLLQVCCRQCIKEDLSSQLPRPLPANEEKNEDEILKSSINLASRLFAMVHFGDLPHEHSNQTRVPWTDGLLKDSVIKHFSKPPVLGDRVKLQKVFNARNLHQIAGIEIYWTSNLADHLRMMEDDKKVAIFHYDSFLEIHNKKDGLLFPKGFVEETRHTLALLLPSGPETRKWFRKQQASQNYKLDPKVIECGRLTADERQIENFMFWRDRLVILKQAFDEATPGNVSQWWWDRRNWVQWYTFWVAAIVLFLTIFFGLLQCIEGAIQAYKALVPTQ